MQEELKVIVTAEVERAMRDLGRVQGQADTTARKFGAFAEKAGQVGSKLTRTLTPAILAAGVASVKFAADIEKQQVALATMLKDADQAQQLYEDWQRFSASTPFQLDEITRSGKALIAFGESADTVTDTLRRIGDVAAGVGAPLGEIAEIYGKARVQQTLFAEDLNQLAGRGIPIFEELAKVMGVNSSEVKKLGSEGKITFDYLEEVFVNLTEQGGQFSGLMEELSKTTAGKFSTAVDNLRLAAAELGKELLPVIKDMLDGFTQLVKGFTSLDDATKKLIIGFGLLAAATGPLLSAFSLLAAHPVVAGLVAITGLVAGAAMELSGMRENVIQTNLKLGLFNKTLEQLGKESGLEDVSATVIEMADKFGLSFEHAAALAKEQGLIVDNLDRIVSATDDQRGDEEAILIAAAEQAKNAANIAESKETIRSETEKELDVLEEIRRLERARAEAWSETQLMYSRTVQGQLEELRAELTAYQAALDAYNAGVDNPAGAQFNITNEGSADMVAAIIEHLEEKIGNLTDTTVEAGEAMREFGQELYSGQTFAEDFFNEIEFGSDILAKSGEIMRDELIPAATKAVEEVGALASSLGEVSLNADSIDELSGYMEKLQNEIDNTIESFDKMLRDGFVDIFEDLGKALIEGGDGMKAIERGLKDLAAEFLSKQAEMLLNAGLMTLLSGNIPVGLALIAASGLVAITSGALGGGGVSTATYEQYILDAEQALMDQRLELLREQIDKERELMNEKLDAIEEHYSNELYLLRRLLDANVISQGEYTNRLGDLQADRSSAEAAAREPVDEAQAEYDAAQQLIDDLNDARTQKLSELSAELLDAKAALDGMPFFAPFAMKAPLLALIATLQSRIAAVEDATTIEEVMAAKNGADFISRDTGLLQYHPNEHVKVTPAPNNGTSGTIINFNGDVYGDADEIARVVTDAVDKAQGRRRLA